MSEFEAANAVTVVDAFLMRDACDAMLAIGDAGDWEQSTVARRDGTMVGGGRARRSQSLCGPDLRTRAPDQFEAIEAELAALFSIVASHLEPWQLTRYRRGDGFDYHLDCGAHGDHPAGERRRTILIVIEEPQAGGATHFRALGKRVSPRRGRLIVWNNLLPTGHCNHAMIHAGRPVWRGRKTILTTFEHELPYCEADRGDAEWQSQRMTSS